MTSRARSTLFLLGIAAISLLGHVLVNQRYGYHRDEFPVLDDAMHLAWGYVVYPPVTPFLARIALTLLGHSLGGLRLLSTLGFCLVIVVSGLMARRLGAGLWGQALAAAAVATATVPVHNSSLFQYVTFDYLAWVLTAYFVICLLTTNDERWWLAVGAALAFGALTKYTIGALILGLALGVLLTPARRHLRSRWLWLGALLSVLLVLPHLFWEYQHHFITLDFLQSIHERDVGEGRADHFLVEQLLVGSSPATIWLWLAGLWFYFFAAGGRPYRVLGWMYLVPLLVFVIARGRFYYIAPAYPMLLAAGSTWFSEKVTTLSTTWRRTAIASAVVLLLGGAVLIVRLLMPVATLHSALWEKQIKLVDDFPEEIGWTDLVDEVARIYHAQPQKGGRVAILAGNYGEAGAINLFGPSHQLPPAISAVNTYWLRGYGEPAPETVVLVGFSRKAAERYFGEVTLAGHVTNSEGVRNEETEDHPDIFVVRHPRKPWPQLWVDLQDFG
ncbi:MAG: glycosyltransferase family 39 protein [Chthoniobacterales bacterium]